MPVTKRRKMGKAGSRSNSRATTPVPDNGSSSPTADDNDEDDNYDDGDDHDGAEKTYTKRHNNNNNNKSSHEKDSLLVLTSEKRRGVYECDYCHTDISQLPRIRCAVCPDFDLCLECFLTTDHTSANRSLKASMEARTAVHSLAASGGQHTQQHQGKQAPSAEASSAGDGAESAAGGTSLPPSWQAGAGTMNHDNSHGYRVCDSTRYPMFPSSRRVIPSRPNSLGDSAGGGGATTTGSVAGSISKGSVNSDNEEDKSQNKEYNDEKGVDDDAMDMDNEDKLASSSVKSDVMLIPDDPKAVWTVEEDLRLLDAIETHGLGNWTDVADAVSGQGSFGKNWKRCMERYFDDFLGRYGYILPPYTLVEDCNAAAAAEEKEDVGDANSNNGDSKDGSSYKDGGGGGSSVGSVTKDIDPTRLSKRRHSIMVRTNSTASVQSTGRFNKKLKLVPTDSLPEYQKVLEVFPMPPVPEKNPPVALGQEVGRDQAAKAEQSFVKMIASLSSEEEKRVRQEWKETKLLKPGGPTVLPDRPEDVVQLPGAELAGFMPRRGDFDIEWENDAEQAVADMEFLPDDLAADKELKLKVLEIYNEKLEEREKRKNFILSRKLHDYRKNQEALLSRDERDLVRRMRLFERFHSPEEHKKFLDDILRAKQLRKGIATLQMYRRMGITSLAEAEKYELDKSRRKFHKHAVLAKEQKDAADGKTKHSGGPGATSASGDAASAGAGASGKKDERASDGIDLLWKCYKSKERGQRKSINRSLSPSESAGAEGAEKESEMGAPAGEREEDSKKPPAENRGQNEGGKAKKDHDATASIDDFAIENMDGFEYLSKKEVQLCRKLRLMPMHYMDVKKVLIHESLQSGLLDKDGSSGRPTLVTIDVEKRNDVIDFMVQAGWVSSKVSVPGQAMAE